MTSVPDMLRPKIEEGIAKFGREVMGIMGDANSPPFFYTIGNHYTNVPDLLVIGALPPSIGTLMLNRMSDMQLASGALGEGMHDIGFNLPMKVRRASAEAKAVYTVQAGQFYGHEEYELLQVLICDPKGHYQDDPLCEYGVQLA